MPRAFLFWPGTPIAQDLRLVVPSLRNARISVDFHWFARISTDFQRIWQLQRINNFYCFARNSIDFQGFARICMYFQRIPMICMAFHNFQRLLTRVCIDFLKNSHHVHWFARISNYFQGFARICKDFQRILMICVDVHGFPRTCKSSQGLSKNSNDFQGCARISNYIERFARISNICRFLLVLYRFLQEQTYKSRLKPVNIR